MGKLIISIIGMVMIVIAVTIQLTHYGDTVNYTYQECSWCLQSNTNYPCSCEIVTVWNEGIGSTILFWFFDLGGTLLLLINIFLKD